MVEKIKEQYKGYSIEYEPLIYAIKAKSDTLVQVYQETGNWGTRIRVFGVRAMNNFNEIAKAVDQCKKWIDEQQKESS